jgi:hypothetical protein
MYGSRQRDCGHLTRGRSRKRDNKPQYATDARETIVMIKNRSQGDGEFRVRIDANQEHLSTRI